MAGREMKCHRVSGSQITLLWEFLDENRSLIAAFNRSLDAKSFAEAKWKELSDRLNAQGDGAHKDWKGWSKYWVDFKAKLKKKAAYVVSANTRTGGGPLVQYLSSVEVKFLDLLAPDFGQGLPGVRVEPFSQQSANSQSSILYPILDTTTSLTIPATINTTPTTATAPSTTTIPAQEVATAATPARSPRRRRRRREPPMSQEAARRGLVQSFQMRAEATLSSSRALERIGQSQSKKRIFVAVSLTYKIFYRELVKIYKEKKRKAEHKNYYMY